MEHKHVQTIQFEKLHSGILADSERKILLQHCSNCEYCTNRMADSFMQKALTNAPKGLKLQIMEKAAQMGRHSDLPVRRVSKQMQLFLYSLKVFAAAAACVILLTVNLESADVRPYYNKNINRIEQLNNGIFEQKVQLNDLLYEFKNSLGGD